MALMAIIVGMTYTFFSNGIGLFQRTSSYNEQMIQYQLFDAILKRDLHHAHSITATNDKEHITIINYDQSRIEYHFEETQINRSMNSIKKTFTLRLTDIDIQEIQGNFNNQTRITLTFDLGKPVTCYYYKAADYATNLNIYLDGR